MNMVSSFFELYTGFHMLGDVFVILFLSLISIPIVRWAYNWNRDFGWYYPLIFFFLVTPIIILLIKGRRSQEKIKLLKIPLPKFILTYIWVNVGFALTSSFADILKYTIVRETFPIFSINLGVVFYLIMYCLAYFIIRKKLITIRHS